MPITLKRFSGKSNSDHYRAKLPRIGNTKGSWKIFKQMIKFLDLHEGNDKHWPGFYSRLERIRSTSSYLLGEQCEELEGRISELYATEYAISVNSGLEAIRLALVALLETGELKIGDRILVPNLTFVATFNAVVLAGLIPVPVDVCKESGCMSIESANKANLEARCKGLICVHLYGVIQNHAELQGFAETNGIIVIEDCAQAHYGEDTDGKKVGSIGRIAATSFYPGKNLGGITDGGAVMTSDPELARLVSSLRNYGSERKYHHSYIGSNSRLSEVSCAFLNEKLQSSSTDRSLRKERGQLYFDLLEGQNITVLDKERWLVGGMHLFPIFCDSRDQLGAALGEDEIQSGIHYPITCSAQKCYKDLHQYCATPVADWMAESVLTLPMDPTLDLASIERVALKVSEYCNG